MEVNNYILCPLVSQSLFHYYNMIVFFTQGFLCMLSQSFLCYLFKHLIILKQLLYAFIYPSC